MVGSGSARRVRDGWAADHARRLQRRDDVLRPLPRLQGLARRRAGGARAAARGRSRTERDGGADVAVVNTCCVTHEAVAKSRKEAARAARTHRRVYVTGCGANLAGDAFAGLPENVVVVAAPQRGDAAVRRGRRRRDRLRAGGRAPRPRACLRQGAGRLLVLVQLLRDPARARASRSRTRRAVLGEIRRRVAPGPPRGRAHRHQPRLLPRPRAPATTCARLVREAGATPGLERLRALLDRDQPRRRPSSSRAARDADGSPPPPRPAPVGRRRRAARDGPPLHGPHVPAQARAAARATSTSRATSIVGFPAEDERGVRAHARRGRASAGLTKVHVFPYSPRPGTATAAEDPVRPQVKKRAQRAAARRVARGVPSRAGTRRSARDDVVLVDRPGRGYGDDYSPLARASAPVGELVARARRRAVSEEGIRRCLTTASSASSTARATTSPRPTASSRSATSTRRRRSHLLVIPERHVDTVPRRSASSAPTRRSGCSSSSPTTAAREGLDGLPWSSSTSGPAAGQTVFHLHWHVLGASCQRLA